ncbi:MAG: hypothetical protein ACK5OA_13925, partial [Acidovorax sp.]
MRVLAPRQLTLVFDRYKSNGLKRLAFGGKTFISLAVRCQPRSRSARSIRPCRTVVLGTLNGNQ